MRAGNPGGRADASARCTTRMLATLTLDPDESMRKASHPVLTWSTDGLKWPPFELVWDQDGTQCLGQPSYVK
jgi:hypothetical protein